MEILRQFNPQTNKAKGKAHLAYPNGPLWNTACGLHLAFVEIASEVTCDKCKWGIMAASPIVQKLMKGG